jgi:lantibiotic biosynthesis protein
VHDQLQLWHRPTGRPLEIELNSAHNAVSQDTNPVYAFLALAGGWGGATWEWGALAQLPHLPRVTAGRVILTGERWLVEREALAAAVASGNPSGRLRDLLPGIGDRRWVGFGEGDRTLAVNMTCDESISALLAKGVSDPMIAFHELPYVEYPAARSDAGAHVAEVLLPVPSSQRGRAPSSLPWKPPAFDRSHGREWVYARFHCGPGSSDLVILAAADLMQRFRDAGLASQWFFVRYDDGVPHVRFRVKPDDGRRDAVMREIEALGHLLGDQGIVTRVVFDTYVPEASRYGGIESLCLAERLFSADSDSVSAFLREKPSERERLDGGVANAFRWAAAVAPTDVDQLELLATWRDNLGLSPSKGTGRLARDRQATISAAIAEAPQDGNDVRTSLKDLAASVTAIDPQMVSLIVNSCMHMHFNRLFAVDQRRLEWLSYEFACRMARSRIARQQSEVPS